MANNIELNLEAVVSVISEARNTILSNQTEVNTSYESLLTQFAESSGETADALRSLQKAEQSLADEVWSVLAELAGSISFAAEEFAKLDTDMKNVMGKTVNKMTNSKAFMEKGTSGRGKKNGQNI